MVSGIVRPKRAPSLHARLVICPLAGIVLVLALGGCVGVTESKPQLSVTEAPTPDLLGAKDIDDAMLQRIARAVGQEPAGAVEPRVALGRNLARKHDLEGAESAYREALGLEPRNVDAWIGLAQVEMARRRTAEAVVTLDQALAAVPGELRLLNAKGVILDRSGRHKEAQALYRQALEAEPQSQMLRNNLGRSLALDGQKEEALAILQPLAREPNAPPSARESLALAQGKARAPGT